MPKPPQKKMPVTRAWLMLATAAFFSTFILFFSTLAFTLPLIAGAGTKAVVDSTLGSTAGTVVGGATVVGVGLLEWGTAGAGAAAVETAGDAAASAIDTVAWGLFYIWFMLAGIELIGGSKETKRLVTSAVSFVVGFIPILNIIPALFIGVAVIVWQTRKEDTEAELKYQAALASAQQQEHRYSFAPAFAAQTV